MRTLLLLSSFAFLLLAPGLASAQGLLYFMKIGDIKGESTDSVHAEKVELLSMDLGTSFPIVFGSSTPRRQVIPNLPASMSPLQGILRRFPRSLRAH
jgi:hypothetical protein